MQVNLKKLRPFGVIVVLGIAVLALITCFTANMGVPEKYSSRHDPEYYSQSPGTMRELVSELEQYVFPQLDGIVEYDLDEDTNKLCIYIESGEFGKVKQVLVRDFGGELFEFCEVK